MHYLTAEDILVLHALVIEEFGGSHGVRDVGLLKSIVEKPRARFGGADLYTTLWTKAAAFCDALVNFHIFVDGNKRAALICTARFLSLNGYELTATNKAAEKMIIDVATKKMTADDVATWLKKHSRKSK